MEVMLLGADRIAEDFISSYVLDFLKTKLDLVTDWSLPLDVNAGVRYSMQQRNQPFASATGNEAFHLLGLSLERAWGGQNQIRTAIRMNNALDEQYLDIGQVVQPGRHYRFSLIFDLKSEE